MRRRLRAWAYGVRREHEGLRLDSLPPRARWRLYAAVAVRSPAQLLAYARIRFRRWAALPGDRWESLLRDQVGVVVRADRRGVLLAIANRTLVPDGWPDVLPEGVIRSYLYADEYWTPE